MSLFQLQAFRFRDVCHPVDTEQGKQFGVYTYAADATASGSFRFARKC